MSYELLTDERGNTKLAKSLNSPYLVASLALAQASTSGYNVCPWSTAGCRGACVAQAGLASVFPSVHEARVRKTKMFFERRPYFIDRLERDIKRMKNRATRLEKTPALRLNTFSDLPWESLLPFWVWQYMQSHGFKLYDYTKSLARARKPSYGGIYTLCYSINETSKPTAVVDHLSNGGTAAMVTTLRLVGGKRDGSRPEDHGMVQVGGKWGDPIPPRIEYGGKLWPTVDGDISDLRFLDPPGSIVVLRMKGTNQRKKDATTSGFSVLTQLTVSA